MNINELTIGQARELANLLGTSSNSKPVPYKPGNAYLIRTVTMTWTGRVREIVGDFLVLDQSSWIADTGRFSEAIKAENLREIEYVGDGACVSLGAIVDSRPWEHALPSATK